MDDSCLIVVELVPGYHPVVVDLVDELKCLDFACQSYAEGAPQVDYIRGAALRILTL